MNIPQMPEEIRNIKMSCSPMCVHTHVLYSKQQLNWISKRYIRWKSVYHFPLNAKIRVVHNFIKPTMFQN